MYYVILVKNRSFWYFDSGTFEKSYANQLFRQLVSEYGKNNVYLCQSDSMLSKDIQKIIHAKNSMLML